MNKKEQTVIFFLCITFLVGAGISLIKYYAQQKNLNTIMINQKDSTKLSQVDSADFVNNETALININTASNKELDVLPGIGPALAQRIVDYRMKNGSFKTKEDILKVSGIGSKRFEALKDKITIK
jgi:competence protein ComEA